VYVDGPDEELDKESQSADDDESPGKPLVDEPTEPALNPDDDDFGADSKEAAAR
jgi:hypothetical protein